MKRTLLLLIALATVAAAPPAPPAVTLEQVISREDAVFNCRIAQLTVGRDGLVYLSSSAAGTGYVLRLSRDGSVKHGGQIIYAVGNATANADGIIASANAHFNHSVNLYDKEFKQFVAANDFLVNDKDGWDAPLRVEAGPSGDFYGVDQHRNRVLRISPAGKVRTSYPIRDAAEAPWGPLNNFRVCEKTASFYWLTQGTIRRAGFDGRTKWTVPARAGGDQWGGYRGGFDVDDNGVLYVIESDAPVIKKYSADGQPAGELTLAVPDFQPATGRWISGLRVWGTEALVRRWDVTELFTVYDLATGAPKHVEYIDHEKLTVTFPSYTWTAGQAVPFAIGFVPATLRPRWRVWAATFGDSDWRELARDGDSLKIPTDFAGLYQVKVSADVQPWQRGQAPEYVVHAVIEVRQPDSRGTVNVLTLNNRVHYGRGEAIPAAVIVRTATSNVPATVAVQLSAAAAPGTTAGEFSVTITNLAVTLGKEIPFAVSPAVTAQLRPGRYQLRAAGPGLTAVPQPLVIGPGLGSAAPFFLVQFGDYGSTFPSGEAWDATDAARQHVTRSAALGMNLFVDRMGAVGLGALGLPNTADGAGVVTATAERLARDPLGVAPEKARIAGALADTLAAYGAVGMHQMAIATGMDAGMPLGTLYDARPPAQMAQTVTNFTAAVLSYPAFRGWDWTANWWTDWDKTFQSPEEKKQVEAARKRVAETGVWEPLVGEVRERALRLHADGQAFFDQTLRQITTNLVTANSGPYRNLTEYPPIAFSNVDEVDSHFQAEQVTVPDWTAQGIDYQRRPGKPIWGHPEVWCDSGTGENILPTILPMLMRGAEGVGCSGPIPNWGVMPVDARNGYPGIPSVFRALAGLVRPYGPWLRTLGNADRVALVVSRRMVEGDDWGAFGGKYFGRLYEAYNSCLYAHRPASFVFVEDLQPGTLKKFAAILVVDQRVALEPALLTALQDARAAGVAVFADASCRPEHVKEFKPLGVGFDQTETTSAINDDYAHFRYPQIFSANAAVLAKTLGPVVPPVAGVENPQVLLTERRAGDGRFLWVVNDVRTELDPAHLWRVALGVATRMPVVATVQLPDVKGRTVYDVFAMQEVRPVAGAVTADLRSLPARLYAILPKPIQRVVLTAPAKVRAGDAFAWRVSVSGPRTTLPVRLELLTPAGATIEEQFLAANDTIRGQMIVPLNLGTDSLILSATELISGKNARRTVKLLGPDGRALPATAVQALPAVPVEIEPAAVTLPVDRLFGPHIRDLAIVNGGKLAVANTFNWDHNLYAVDLATGAIRWRQRVGHYFAFAPQAAGDGLAVQGYDLNSAEGYHLYLADRDGKLQRRFALEGLPNRLPFWFIPGMLKDRINNFAVPATGDWVAAAGDLGLVVFKVERSTLNSQLSTLNPQPPPAAILWQQDWWKTGRRNVRLATLGNDTLLMVEGVTVTAFDAHTGQQRWQVVLAPVGALTELAISDDGRTCALLTTTGSGRLFVLRDGKVVRALAANGSELRLSPRGDRVAIADGHLLKLYSVADGLQWSFSGNDALLFPRFSPDGKRLAVASRLGTVSVFDEAGATVFERDWGALAVPAWLPDGDLLLGTWMGVMCRLDRAYRPRWETRLAPTTADMHGQLLTADSTPTTRVTNWANNAPAAWPLTPNLLQATNCFTRVLGGDRAVELQNPVAELYDGKPAAPGKPWLTWDTLQGFDSGWVASASVLFDAFNRQLRLKAITFVEDPAHPESWLRDATLQYWDTVTEQWVTVQSLLSDSAVHTHVLAKPVEAARFRLIPPPGANGWPIGNLRFGEVVFHGDELGCSHPDVQAKRPVAVLFDEKENDLQMLMSRGGLTYKYEGAFAGGKCLQLAADKTVGPAYQPPFAETMPNWDFEIVEKPEPGQYRYLQFAWRALEPATKGITLHISSGVYGQKVGFSAGQYTAGEGEKPDPIAATPPAQWTVVRVDLYALMGKPVRIRALQLSTVGGPAAFDQILLGRTEQDLLAVHP